MEKDTSLFYYYSMPQLPENCFLNLNNEIAYRNMLMFPSDDKIHFELPVFEDHSYNTICNKDGLKALIKRPAENEKYIIFHTSSQKLKKKFIIGYYKVAREFYYETRMWDNYGFVWGIESSQVHLLKKDDLEYTGIIPRTPPRSWGSNERWGPILEQLLDEISSRQNIAELYKSETERLVNLFKNPERIREWREHCSCCENNKCTFSIRNRRYNNVNPESDLISVIQHAYSSNLYSRNELNNLQKHYLR